MESRPYIKKYNLTQDKAQWACWQVHLRVEERASSGNQIGADESDDDVDQKHDKDIYVTAVRRKYIPPLMECYQDILIYSVFNFEPSSTEQEMARASRLFLR